MALGISKDHPLAVKEELSASDLVGQTVLYYSNESSIYLQSAFLATLPRNHTYDVQRVATIEQMQTLVALGHAVAFYPQSFPLFSNEWVVFRHLQTSLSSASQRYAIRLIYRPDNNLNGLQYYRQFLLKTIK